MATSPNSIRILVTGGGSGGHATPALATIEAIEELAGEDGSWKPTFLYVGSHKGIERPLAQAAAIPYTAIATGKLRRSRHLLGHFSGQNILDVLRLPWGVLQALTVVIRFRPHVILSTGGFVCVPPVIAGSLLRVPVLTHEQTVQMGLANRIASRMANRVALTFDSAREDLPGRLQDKALVTGNPVRPVIFNGNREAALELAGFPADSDLPTVYVTGGALGAQHINRAVEESLPDLLAMCRIIHQCGRQNTDGLSEVDRLRGVRSTLPKHLQDRYHVVDFVADEIGHFYALAEVVVSRSGAGTLAELFALGKPAILIPLVPTGGDEQRRNAQHAQNAGAAHIIEQADISGERLCKELRAVLGDGENRQSMSVSAKRLALPDAAKHLAATVIALAGVRPRDGQA
jgi:UDP-N-acetylglucosamine--N-acetylmuramyl-(pentapeptide) pyrophosphoryl-undecaprenol N-acetylglucosamine transferase